MEMGLVQKTFESQNNSAEFQENLISTPLKALIVAVTAVASAAIGFLLASLAGLAIGTLVGTGLGFTVIVIGTHFMRQPQTDSNLAQKVVSVNDQAKKRVILTPKSNELEESAAAISDFSPFTNLDRNSNQPQLLLPEPAEIVIQDLTDVTDPDSAESLIKFYKRLPIDGKPQFDGCSTTEQARNIQNWMKENPEALNLKSLDLSNSELTRLPNEIGLFVHLKKLNLRGNQIEGLPAAIGNLHSLMHLTLSHNQLKSLPSEIGNLASLIELDLSLNPIENLPAKIGNLDHDGEGFYSSTQ